VETVKLYYAATSPYVRKVMACAITRGLEARIKLHPSNPHSSPVDLLADNPTSKVPCLITDDGLSLYDSPVICEFLDSLGDALPLFPVSSAARWRALKFQAMCDGILDAAVPCRGEQQRSKEAARDAAIARYKAAMFRTVDALEADPPHRHIDIGSLAVACALGYLDFRYAADPWRPGRPKLAAWFEEFSKNPGIAQTVPKE
jgi:glutathione S-transferase